MDTKWIKLKRTTAREVFTKLTTKINNSKENPINENYLAENEIEDLHDLKNQLNKKLKALKELDNAIEAEIKTKELTKEIKGSDKYWEMNIAFKTKLDRCLTCLEKECYSERQIESSCHNEGLI